VSTAYCFASFKTTHLCFADAVQTDQDQQGRAKVSPSLGCRDSRHDDVLCLIRRRLELDGCLRDEDLAAVFGAFKEVRPFYSSRRAFAQ
jgi:hypothetical protein